jgi:hypothetical protein
MNTLTSILGTTCGFFMIIELSNDKREQVVSAGSLTEAGAMAKQLLYRFYLIEPYDLALPIVDEGYSLPVSRGLPHTH